MLTAEEQAQVKAGDTVAWVRPKRGGLATRSWGLVRWTTPEGVNVTTGGAGNNGWRGLIPWERVREHWSGRAEFDRHYG